MGASADCRIELTGVEGGSVEARSVLGDRFAGWNRIGLDDVVFGVRRMFLNEAVQFGTVDGLMELRKVVYGLEIVYLFLYI